MDEEREGRCMESSTRAILSSEQLLPKECLGCLAPSPRTTPISIPQGHSSVWSYRLSIRQPQCKGLSFLMRYMSHPGTIKTALLWQNVLCCMFVLWCLRKVDKFKYESTRSGGNKEGKWQRVFKGISFSHLIRIFTIHHR